MLRRLHHDQPASFAFTPANLAWAQGQITKYPAGRQASAISPLFWRAQRQQGLPRGCGNENNTETLGFVH